MAIQISKTTTQFPHGIYTVMVTPFDEDFTIDYISLKKWFDNQVLTNIAGFVLMGTTSESPTLSREEQFEILVKISEWNKKLEEPKYLILGCGGNDTFETVEFSKKCVSYCDAFMVTVPSYNKPTQNGIYEHYKYFCSDKILSSKPLMIYNVPSRTGINMDVSTIKRVHEDFKNIIAIKEASGSMSQLIQLKSQVPTLKIFSGDDLLTLDFLIHGGCGVISVASNIIPEIMCKLYDNFITEYYKKEYVKYSTFDLFYRYKLPQFFTELFCETNPIPVKFLLYHTKVFTNNILRLPMTSLSENLHQKVIDAYSTSINVIL
jgi:4-hydroxy-tetrahydrodipicolinate synthase